MRKFLMILAATAALSGLAACSSGGSDSSDGDATTTTAPKETTTTTEPAIPADEWGAAFCTSFEAWLGGIKTASDAVSENVEVGNVPSLQVAVSELYGTVSKTTKTLIEEIEAAGAPDIEDGDAFNEELIAKFEAFDAAALDAQEQVEALPTDDVATFQADVDELGRTFQADVDEVSSAISELGEEYPSQDLSDAILSSCTF